MKTRQIAVLRVYSMHIRRHLGCYNLQNRKPASPIQTETQPTILWKVENTQRTRLQTTTTATTLATSRVGGDGSDVLDTADSHAGTSEGTEGGLSTGTGGLGAVTYFISLRLGLTPWNHNIPPVARILMCRALMPSSLQRAATS